MACDPAAITARIAELEREREAEDRAADASPGGVGYDIRGRIREINEKIEQLKREFDICVSVPDEGDAPPVETVFEILHGSMRFPTEGLDEVNGIRIAGQLGFWFSASRRHVRIHEWLRSGATIVSFSDGENVIFQAAGTMQRQRSGSVDANGHMRIPIVLHIFAGDYPFPAKANITLRTTSPGVLGFFLDPPEVWAEGRPLRVEDGRPTVDMVGEGTFRVGSILSGPVIMYLKGAFPAGFRTS